MTVVFYCSNVVYMNRARNNIVHKENAVIQKCLLSPSETIAGTWNTKGNKTQRLVGKHTQEPMLAAMTNTLLDVCTMWSGSTEGEAANPALERQQKSTGNI